MADVCFPNRKKLCLSRELRYVDEICFADRFCLRVRVTSLNTKPEVLLSHRCRHLKIVHEVITPQRVARFRRKKVA